MKLVETMSKATETMGTGADYARSGCVCNGTVAVANSHNKGPGYCVGYCGSAGSVTRQANANVAYSA